MKKSFILLSIVCISLFLCSCATADTAVNKSTVSVSGTGSVTLNADVVSFTVSVSETAETTGLAQQAANKKMSQILSIIRSYGIQEEDITTTALNFSSEYYWEDGRQIKTGEVVSQSLYIRMKDIEKFGSLVDDLGSKVSGISFYSVSFEAEDYSQAYREARKLAFQDAYEKALIYSESSGQKLGKALSINDGYTNTSSVRSLNYDAKMAYAVVEEAVYSTEAPTGNLNVTVSCSVVFELE